jgi:hypothetical protein
MFGNRALLKKGKKKWRRNVADVVAAWLPLSNPRKWCSEAVTPRN